MRFLLCIIMVAMLGSAQVALAQSCDTGGCDGQQACCPNCNYVCKFTVEKEMVGDQCFEVKCEPICIPKSVFPGKSCLALAARVAVVAIPDATEDVTAVVTMAVAAVVAILANTDLDVRRSKS